MNFACVSILLGALLACANAQLNKEDIPADVLEAMTNCADVASLTIDDVLGRCILLDDGDRAICGKFLFCLALHYGFIDEKGVLDIDKAVAEAKVSCERFDLKVDVEELKACTEHCTTAYTGGLPDCGSQAEIEYLLAVMSQCIVEDCILEMM